MTSTQDLYYNGPVDIAFVDVFPPDADHPRWLVCIRARGQYTPATRDTLGEAWEAALTYAKLRPNQVRRWVARWCYATTAAVYSPTHPHDFERMKFLGQFQMDSLWVAERHEYYD